MKAEIISIGDELLIGQVINTNAAWLASELFATGITTSRITDISDSKKELKAVINESAKRVNLVILTGGLGPTNDDITKEALCEYFRSELVTNDFVLEHIKSVFLKKKRDLNELNKKQADVPNNCIVLPNELGTAPGMIFSKEELVLVSLPGVPFEMKHIFDNSLKEFLTVRYNLHKLFLQTVMVCGIAESVLSDKLSGWEEKLRKNKLNLAYLPQPGIIRLRITAKNGVSGSKALIDNSLNDLKSLIGNYVFAVGNHTLEEITGKLLLSENATLSTAESCTGGYISHLITSVSGSSAYYKGSVIAYSNEVKSGLLDVGYCELEEYGAVSEVVVRQMAENCRKLFGTSYSVAVSGIAGPEGGTPAKPVGTVWIAVSGNRATLTKKFIFPGDRARIIILSAVEALNLLRKSILIKNI